MTSPSSHLHPSSPGGSAFTRVAGAALLLLVLVFVGVRAALLVGWLPVWIEAVEEEVPGDARWGSPGGSGAVLYVRGSRPEVPGFSAGDWSWSWINFLQQEVGPYTVTSSAVAPGAEAVLAVLPRSVAGVPPSGWRSWVEAGGVLIVECPGAAWAGDLGTTAATSGLEMHEVMSPLLTDRLRVALDSCKTADPVGEIIAEDGDGHALLWRRRIGAGALLGLGFDLGRSLLAMQQGVPADDLSLENRFPDRHRTLLQTSDLVWHESFLRSDDPFADRLERLVGLAVDEITPRPRLWHLPGAAAGVFVMSHDDEGFGDRSRWMTEHEARLGVSSTSLFMPGHRLTPEGVEAMAADGSEIGLHWNRVEAAGAPFDAGGLPGLPWSRRAHSLAEQADWLRERLPGADIVSARTHYLIWGPDYGSGFRALAAQGISIDSSYGVDFGERGYLFGTGGPFQALDRNGLPLPVWEVPHLMAEDLEATPEWLEEILLASRDDRHQVITVLFHPGNMDWRPSVGLYRFWKQSYLQAQRYDHPILTLAQVVGHHQRRIAGDVRLQRLDSRLRITVRAEGPGHALALPASLGGRSLQVQHAEVRRVREEGRDTILVPVPPGISSVEVILGSR